MTDYDIEPTESSNPSQPSITYEPYYDNLEYIEITIEKTSDNSKPTKVQLSILGCANPAPFNTKPQVDKITTMSSTVLLSTVSTGSSISGMSTVTSSPSSISTTRPCEEMQAVDEATAKKITVSPRDLPEQEKVGFQPTSPQGVSFPENETKPTLTVHFGKPAEVHTIRIPRDTTPGANTGSFSVTFYSPDGKKINEIPIQSNTSLVDDNKKPATIDASQIPSTTPISRVDIQFLSTTDNKSPKGVVLDIKACTESTTGLYSTIYFIIRETRFSRHDCGHINTGYCK